MSSNYTAYRNANNEGGYGYNPHEAQMLADAKAAADARIDSILARYDELRAAWNAAVAKYAKNGQLTMQALAQIEREVGVTLSEIKIAKARMA